MREDDLTLNLVNPNVCSHFDLRTFARCQVRSKGIATNLIDIGSGRENVVETRNTTIIDSSTSDIAISIEKIVYDQAFLLDIRKSIMKAHVDAQLIKQPMLVYMMRMALAEINNIIESGRQ